MFFSKLSFGIINAVVSFGKDFFEVNAKFKLGALVNDRVGVQNPCFWDQSTTSSDQILSRSTYGTLLGFKSGTPIGPKQVSRYPLIISTVFLTLLKVDAALVKG